MALPSLLFRIKKGKEPQWTLLSFNLNRARIEHNIFKRKISNGEHNIIVSKQTWSLCTHKAVSLNLVVGEGESLGFHWAGDGSGVSSRELTLQVS